MADTTITEDQINQMLVICKDVQERVKANGMPELDEDIAEMIVLLEEALAAPPPVPDPEALRKKKEEEDPVKPIIDPARPPEQAVKPKVEAKPEEKVEHTKEAFRGEKHAPVPPKVVPLAEAKEKHKEEKHKEEQHKPKYR